MPFVKANITEEKKMIQELIDSDPELKKHNDEWNKEYEFRKKLVLARKQSGLTQKEVSMITGLDQRAISRAEVDSEVSPNIKTIIKYIDALGFQLDIIPKQT